MTAIAVRRAAAVVAATLVALGFGRGSRRRRGSRLRGRQFGGLATLFALDLFAHQRFLTGAERGLALFLSLARGDFFRRQDGGDRARRRGGGRLRLGLRFRFGFYLGLRFRLRL
ncbi:hypothetical protein, partial [Chromobacterium phragmitis]|uniref:hypothetical protein n=1 Tax=Chromobacterium phragmitis TaxID=2202141 RepID=UPI003D36E6A0